MSTRLQSIPLDTEWIECESSNLGRYGYSTEREALIVRFKDKHGNPLGYWQYQGNEALTLFQKMMIAESVGEFFRANVRNNAQLKAEELKGELNTQSPHASSVVFGLVLVLVITLAGCDEPNTERARSNASPEPTATAKPIPHMQPAHWVERPYCCSDNKKQYFLICNEGEKVIGEVFGSDSFNACGGNGDCYGSYMTVAQAKKHMEDVVSDPTNWEGRGSGLLQCP